MRRNLLLFHAVLDYVMGGLLLIGPWLFGFADDTRAAAITMAFGAALIAYSLFTDYEPALVRKLPLVVHGGLDALCGGLLIGAPWMFGFAAATWIPHLVVGTVLAARPILLLLALRIDKRLTEWFPHRPGRVAHR